MLSCACILSIRTLPLLVPKQRVARQMMTATRVITARTEKFALSTKNRTVTTTSVAWAMVVREPD